MPIVWRKEESGYSIVIWQSNERLPDLFQSVSLADDEKKQLASFRSESRKREWLTVRNALKGLGIPDAKIVYDTFGKPHLESGKSISISHSNEFVAVMISESGRIGIDIEVLHERIKKLSQKFIGEKEKTDIGEEIAIEKLHVYWGAKEVLYKIHGIGGIDFKKDLFVQSFQYTDFGILHASILKINSERDVNIYWERSGKYMITWGIDNEN